MTEKTDLPALIAEVRRLDAEARDLKTWCVHVRDDDTAQVYATARGLCRQVVPVAETTPEIGPLIAHYRTAAPLLADECERLQAEVTQLRAERDMPCAHRLEEERLQERVRVLEELLTDAVPFVLDAARNYGPPEAKAWLPRARAALEGIEVE